MGDPLEAVIVAAGLSPDLLGVCREQSFTVETLAGASQDELLALGVKSVHSRRALVDAAVRAVDAGQATGHPTPRSMLTRSPRGSTEHLTLTNRRNTMQDRRHSSAWASAVDDRNAHRRSAQWGPSDNIRESWRSHNGKKRFSVAERKDLNNRLGFGIQPWMGSVTEHAVQPITAYPARFAGNLVYSALVGVPLALFFCVTGLLLFVPIITHEYARKCFVMAKFLVYPFRKVLVVRTGAAASQENEQLPATLSQTYGTTTALKTIDSNAVDIPVITASDVPPELKHSAKSIVYMILGAPLLSLIVAPIGLFTLFLAFSSPIADFLRDVLFHVVWGEGALGAPIEVISERDWMTEKRAQQNRQKMAAFQQQQQACDVPALSSADSSSISIELVGPGGLAYLKRSIYGVNILLVNTLAFVPVNFVFYFVMDDDWVEDNSIVVMVLGLISLVPLSYFIGHSVASIAAQTSFFVGAILNATFGSLIELIIYFMALSKGLNDVVTYATTGALLACMLLLPGLSMLFGGLYYKEQQFNQKAGQTSAIMMFVAISGLLMPSVFFAVNHESAMECDDCKTFTNGSFDCLTCTFKVENFSDNKLFTEKVRPMSYGVCIMLLLCYLVGLLFALHTHTFVYDEKEEEEEEQLLQDDVHCAPENNGAHPLRENPFSSAAGSERGLDRASAVEESHGAHGPAWPRRVCVTILVVATACFAVCSESLLGGLEPSLHKMGVSQSFAGLTIIAVVPCIAEFVNAIQFAMADNIKLSLEIGNIAAIQMVLVQIPVLTIGSNLMGKGTPDTGFVLLYPLLNVTSGFIATIVITYVLIDGGTNYFKGVALVCHFFEQVFSYSLPTQLVIYFIILLMFYYKPDTEVY